MAKWRENLGVSYERLSYEMGFWNVEGSCAYAVIAGIFTVTIRGQTTARTGTLAYTFSKHGDEWKIDAQAWGRTRDGIKSLNRKRRDARIRRHPTLASDPRSGAHGPLEFLLFRDGAGARAWVSAIKETIYWRRRCGPASLRTSAG